MPVKQSCLHCCQADCTAKEQPNFDGLQVNTADGHDEKLVDARMLNVTSSTNSRQTTAKQTTAKSNLISMRRHSDYCLKRFMTSFDKLGTFLNRRHPRAKTHMEAHARRDALQRGNTF